VDGLNTLHVCGRALDFRRFAAYPAQALNWADRSAGPAITHDAGWVGSAVCAGLDHVGTMVSGSPEDCAREVEGAVRQDCGWPPGDRPGVHVRPRGFPSSLASRLHIAPRRPGGHR
jgi:hypothetical protein